MIVKGSSLLSCPCAYLYNYSMFVALNTATWYRVTRMVKCLSGTGRPWNSTTSSRRMMLCVVKCCGTLTKPPRSLLPAGTVLSSFGTRSLPTCCTYFFYGPWFSNQCKLVTCFTKHICLTLSRAVLLQRAWFKYKVKSKVLYKSFFAQSKELAVWNKVNLRLAVNTSSIKSDLCGLGAR